VARYPNVSDHGIHLGLFSEDVINSAITLNRELGGHAAGLRAAPLAMAQ
jgi:hypothetical protein